MVAHLSHNDNVCFGSFTSCPSRRSLSATTPWRDTSANRGSYYSNSYLYIVTRNVFPLPNPPRNRARVACNRHSALESVDKDVTSLSVCDPCCCHCDLRVYVPVSAPPLLQRLSQMIRGDSTEIGYSFFYNLSCLQCTEVDIIYASIFLISIRKVEPAMFLCVSLSPSIVAKRPKASFAIYNISQANKPFFS